MKFQIQKFMGVVVAALLVLFLAAGASYAQPPIATYEVTITNLTSGQPLTPPLIATHTSSVRVFEVGRPARFELKEIAENGNLTPMFDGLSGLNGVFDVQTAGAPLVPDGTPGAAMFDDSVTMTITARRGTDYLFFASMLICTNDGFTGIDALHLPDQVGDSTTIFTDGYDAGTEINTEDFADIVPPCQGLIGVTSDDAGTGTSNPALAENGVIRHHPGIQGGNDLVPGTHGWTDPVAEVTVTRVD